MRKIVLIITLMSVQSLWARPNTIDFPCSDVQDMLKDNGTLILSHGNPYLYSKFVSKQSLCEISQKPRRAFAISQDKFKCQLGYVCGAKDDFDTYIAPHTIHICKEGAVTVTVEHDSSNDQDRTVVKICKSGKWIKR